MKTVNPRLIVNNRAWKNHASFCAVRGRFRDYQVRTKGKSRFDALNTFEPRVRTLKELLPQLFAWLDAREFLTAVRTRFLDRQYSEVQLAFDQVQCADGESGHWLHTALNGLPDWAAGRFLAAPETYCRLTQAKQNAADQLRFFCSALHVERAISGESDMVPNVVSSCWSGIGDVYLSGDAVVDPRTEAWASESTFIAPLIDGVIPLDVASPHARFADSMLDCAFEAYTPDEVATLWSDLESTFKKIHSVCCPASLLIRTFVTVIIARKNPRSPNNSGSSSSSSHIGRIILRNGHSMDAGRLADALIHEAIHQLLYVLEIPELFVTSPSNNGVRIRSPWSGNFLSLHQYVHACFVWYGLAQFWRLAGQTDAFPPEVSRRCLRKACSGFDGGNPIDLLVPHSCGISRDVMDAVGALAGELPGAAVAGR